MVNSTENTTERYRSIVREAERLFIENGYNGTSVADIAEAAGVAQGLINYHFGSKEELLIHVLKSSRSVMLEQLNSISQCDQTAEVKLRMAIQMLLELADSGLALTQMTLISFFETSFTNKIRIALVESLNDQVSGFADLIKEGIDQGEFKPVGSRRTTHLIVGMVFEMIRLAVVGEEELKPAEMADEITSILMDGMRS